MHFAQKAATEFQVQGLSLSSRSFFQFPFPVVSRESLTVSPSNMGGSPSAKEMSVCMCVCVCVGVEKSLFLPCLVFIVAHGLFSSCSKRELFSSCGSQASHCAGSSCCRARALGAHASGAVGLIVLWHMDSSQTRG